LWVCCLDFSAAVAQLSTLGRLLPPMKKLLPQLLIIVAILSQLVWFIWPRFSDMPSPRFRHAFESTMSSPKPVQDAAIAEAQRLDAADGSREAILILALIGAADIALIYFFWNSGVKKPAA
jgi:hypothetical protein